MKRITFTFDIPDEWDLEVCNFNAFLGMHQVAKMPWGKPLKIKTGFCSHCGKCCQRIKCEHLIPDGGDRLRCGHDARMPLSCAMGDGGGMIEGCSCKWKEAAMQPVIVED